MTRIFTQKDTGVFVQFEPGKDVFYLGDCLDLDSIPNPRFGGRDPIQCWNRNRDGFVTLGEKLTPPGMIEFTLSELYTSVASWLEQANCPFTLYALQRSCGDAGVFGNWDRGSAVVQTRIMDDPLTNVKHHIDDNETMHEFNVNAFPPRIDFWRNSVARRTTTEANALNAIAPCLQHFCGGDCGAQQEQCEVWYAAADAGAGVTANVMVSDDRGVTWAATAADPFAVDENILSIACFPINKTTTRILAVRETDPAAPLEIAYSDDGGTTWSLVVVGSTNGEAATGPKCLVALDQYHIWLGTSLGKIWFSDDGGETWSEQVDTGANAVNALSFVDENIGFSVGNVDTVFYTIDGGAHWTAGVATGTGDDLLWVFAFNQYRVIVGTDSSVSSTPLLISFDGAQTWEVRTFTGSTTETVVDGDFYNDLVGIILTNTAGPVGSVHITVNGGRTWEELAVPTNSGLNAVRMCGVNEAVSVGEANGGTAVILGI